MPRSVGSNLQALLDLPNCETQTTLIITLADASVVYLATKAVTLLSHDYDPELRSTGEIKQSIAASTDRVNVRIQNVDKAFGSSVTDEDLVKATAAIGRYYTDPSGVLGAARVELFRGQLKPTGLDENVSENEILNDLAAAGYCVANWTLAPNCQFRYKDADTCGFSGGAATCNKRRASMDGCAGKIVTGSTTNEYRFGGMEWTNPVAAAPPMGGGGDGDGDHYTCPRIDQYVLVRGMDGEPTPKPVVRLSKRDLLFNPVTGTFHEIASLKLVRDQPIVRLITEDRSMCYSSPTHRVIRRIEDERGTPVEDMYAGYSVLSWGIGLADTVAAHVAAIDETGDVMEIHMADGHIYAAGHTPRAFVVAHNLKPIDPLELP